MILVQIGTPLFLDGNSATFVAAIMTWTILCFFGTKISRNKKFPQPENSNFMQALLLMVCNRAFAVMDKTQKDIIKTLETENLKNFSKAIAESDEEKNPYKREMMELINKLQFKTVNFYNKYLEQDKSVKSVHHKVVTDSMEFFSSFFYSFLFCVFILVVDCMGKDDMPWLINAVCLTAIVSFTYWILIWGHYWWSIKKREGNTDLISYEFKFWTCVLVFIAMIAIIGLANIINLKTEIMNYIYIGGIVFIGIFAMLNYIKRRKCVFTHYFNLIHFFLVIFYIGILSWLQERFLLNDIHFTAESAKFLSILFILLSGLIFPLFIPFLRLKWEIGYTNIKLNRAKRRYIKDTQKLKDKLNAHFDNLNKLRTLVAKKETLK